MFTWAFAWFAFFVRLWISLIQILGISFLVFYVIQMHYKVKRLESSLSWFLSKSDVDSKIQQQASEQTPAMSQSKKLLKEAEIVAEAFSEALPAPSLAENEGPVKGVWIDKKPTTQVVDALPEFVDSPEHEKSREKGFRESIRLLNSVHVFLTDIITHRIKREEIAFKTMLQSLSGNDDQKKKKIRVYIESLYQDTPDEVNLIEAHHTLRQVMLQGIDFSKSKLQKERDATETQQEISSQIQSLAYYAASWVGVSPLLNIFMGNSIPKSSNQESLNVVEEILQKKQEDLDHISSTYTVLETAFKSIYGMKQEHFDALEHQARRLITKMSASIQTRQVSTFTPEEIALLGPSHRKRIDSQYTASQELYPALSGRVQYVQLSKPLNPLVVEAAIPLTWSQWARSLVLPVQKETAPLSYQPSIKPARIAVSKKLSPLFSQ